ncbi:MAG: sugar phosphate isomerase/epimerase [Armatimonadetes bacterium]|nr:sugar phosphate isomerase/epimerase [Armatimonadota bacterium]
MANPRIGARLVIYGDRWQRDLPAVLREVARAGYDGVEVGALREHYTAETVRQCLSETGLSLAGTRAECADLRDPAKLSAHLDFVTALGGSYLTCAGVGSVEGIHTYERAAETLNAAGRECRHRGVILCYANQDRDFDPLEGDRGIHRLAERIHPREAKLCVDIYGIHAGGEDPAAFIARYADRIAYYHVRDGNEGGVTELGRGKVDLPRAIEAARRTNPDWLVCAQERTEKTPEESLVQSRQYLRDQLGL